MPICRSYSLAFQIGARIPKAWFNVHSATVTRRTPAANEATCEAESSSPKLTMRTVAPAGDASRSMSAAPVSATENVAAPHPRERHAFLKDARIFEDSEEREREKPGGYRGEMSDHRVPRTRPRTLRRFEEEVRRRPEAREYQRLREEISGESAHSEGGRRSSGAIRQSATMRAWGAACFMRVLSHFIWIPVSGSQASTTRSSSASPTPLAACSIMIHAMSHALAMT